MLDKNYIVTKSNILINCSYNLTSQQQKIILTLASMVQPQDIEFKNYEFKIKDFIELLGVKDDKKYTAIPKTIEGLMKPFKILDDGDLIQIGWLSSAVHKRKKGIILLRFDPTLKPYMLGLKEFYTSYKLENILSLKSKYSIRVYEILKSNLFKKQVTIELQDLKNMIGVNEKSYNVYQNVKNRILIQAQKELKAKTDISFTYDEIKTGRKVTSINFYINANKTKNKADTEACSTLESKSTNEEEKSLTELINTVKSIFKENITGKEAMFILNTAKSDINIIKEKYALSQDVSKIGNIVGWMIKAIKEDYTIPKDKAKVGSFNDYEQRDYDFDALEKKLLGWDKEEKIKETGEEFQQLTVK
jgi:plasmid replication initiation protein